MRHNSKKVWKSSALFMAGALLLSGCAGASAQKESETAAQTSAAETKSETETETGQEAKAEAVLVIPTPEELNIPEVIIPELTFTQQSRIGVCTNTDDSRISQFAEVMEIAKPFTYAPGYGQNIVTQGMDQSEETGHIYVSGYFKREEDNPFEKTGNPTAIAVLDRDGRLTGEYLMHNEDGSAFTSHMGGVAVTENMLFVSGSQRKDEEGNVSYWIAGIPLAELETEGSHVVEVKDYYRVPVQPSYLNYSNGILWVGNFYHAEEKSYKAPSTLGKIQADNDDEKFGAYLLGYDLSEKGAERMLPAEGQEMAMPDADKLYATTDRIQGMTMLSNGHIVLSRSYGRTANSQLQSYDPKKAQIKKTTLGDTEYDCIMLEKSTCLLKEYTMLPMTEGITVKNDGNGNEILVLSESGSVVFDGDGTYDTKKGLFRTDYIWQAEMP